MSVHVINYINGKKHMERVADSADYLRLRQSEEQKRITAAARNGETYVNNRGDKISVKARLKQFVYSCLPNDDGSLKGTKRLSNAVSMDIDYPGESCGKTLEEWKMEVMEKVLSKTQEAGSLMFGDSATKGFHFVFRRHPELSQEENLKWASALLEVPYDECAKDHTRVMYEPSGDIYLLDEDLFSTEIVTALQCDSSKDATSVVNSPKAEVTNTELTYKGMEYAKIISKYWELFNDDKEPVEGDRNVKTFELAMVLRPICDYSLEKLRQVVPNYWGEGNEAEYIQTLENALKEPRKGMPYRLNKVLAELKQERRVAATGGTLSTPPPLPKHLPPLIRLLTKNVPNQYKAATASAVFPALAAHLHGVKFRYWDNVLHEATFMHLLIGRQSIGKGCIKQPIDLIIENIKEHDKPNRAREAEWKRNNPSGKSKAKDPRPEDICIQYLIDNLTDAVFNQRVVDADHNGEHYLYVIVDEVEALKNVTSKGTVDEVLLLIRKAFDNALHGQERVGADSVTGIAPLRWVWNASTTPPNARKFFYKAVNDGTISRLDTATIVKSEEDPDPVYGIYDDKYREELKPYLNRLEAANGLIECSQSKKLALAMKAENQDLANLYESEAFLVFSYRANVIAWLKGMLLYVAHGCRWSKEIEDFVRWSQSYNLWCKMVFFGQQLEEELRKEMEIQRTSGPQNLLSLLNDSFTLADYQLMRMQQGKEGDGASTLRQWKSRGYIEYDDLADCYHKTGKKAPV